MQRVHSGCACSTLAIITVSHSSSLYCSAVPSHTRKQTKNPVSLDNIFADTSLSASQYLLEILLTSLFPILCHSTSGRSGDLSTLIDPASCYDTCFRWIRTCDPTAPSTPVLELRCGTRFFKKREIHCRICKKGKKGKQEGKVMVDVELRNP